MARLKLQQDGYWVNQDTGERFTPGQVNAMVGYQQNRQNFPDLPTYNPPPPNQGTLSSLGGGVAQGLMMIPAGATKLVNPRLGEYFSAEVANQYPAQGVSGFVGNVAGGAVPTLASIALTGGSAAVPLGAAFGIAGAGEGRGAIYRHEQQTGQDVHPIQETGAMLGYGALWGGTEAFAASRFAENIANSLRASGHLAPTVADVATQAAKHPVQTAIENVSEKYPFWSSVATGGLSMGARQVGQNVVDAATFDSSRRPLEGVLHATAAGALGGGLIHEGNVLAKQRSEYVAAKKANDWLKENVFNKKPTGTDTAEPQQTADVSPKTQEGGTKSLSLKDLMNKNTEQIGQIRAMDTGVPESQPGTLRPRAIEPEQVQPINPNEKFNQAYTQNKVPVEMENKLKPGENALSVHDISKTLQNDFDVTVHLGRTGHGKRVPGLFKVFQEVIRLRKGEETELGVLTHEIAHDVDKKIDLTNKAKLPTDIKAELGTLDYNPKLKRADEGFAEYMRYFFTHGPSHAASLAPKFTAYFDTILKANPSLKANIDKALGLIENYRYQGAGNRIDQMISKDGKPPEVIGMPLGERIKNLWEKAKFVFTRSWKEQGIALQQYSEEARRLLKEQTGYELRPGEDPFQLFTALNQGTYEPMAMHALENGIFTLEGSPQKIGPGLKEVFKDIKSETEYGEWLKFLYARHAIEAHTKPFTRSDGTKITKDPGITLEDARYWYDKTKNPAWEEAAQKLTELNNALVEVLYRTGAMDSASRDAIISAYDTYIPLFRVKDSQGLQRAFSKGGGFADPQNVFKGRRGSQLPIVDPIQATMEQALRVYRRASAQMVQNAIINISKATEGFGYQSELVKPLTEVTEFSLGAISKQLEKLGVDEWILDKLDPQAALFLYREDYISKAGDPVVRFIEDGKPVLYQLDADLYRFAKGMDRYTLPWFLDITLGKTTRALKLGATGLNATFTARNYIRDVMTFFFQSKYTNLKQQIFSPPEMLVSYIYTAGKHLQGKQGDPIVELFKQYGGEMANMLGLDRKYTARSVGRYLPKNSTQRALDLLRPHNVIDTMRSVVGVTENAPRLAEFKAVLEKNGYDRARIERGDTPPLDVIIEGINAAHDVTVNFKRMGELGKIANQAIPFFNAPLESISKFARTWRDNPKAAFIKSAAFAAATMAYWYAKKDEDWYQESPPWLKYGYWTVSNSEGKPVARIPRPFEWGWTVSAGTEMILNKMYKDNPGELMRYLSTAIPSLVPDVTSVAVARPAMEVAFNWDIFRKSPVVSEYLQKLEPRDQYTDKNTALMIAIGQYLNISPAKLDHLLTGYTGGAYSNVMKMLEKIAIGGEANLADYPVVGGFTLRQDYSQSAVDMDQEIKQIEQRYNSLKQKGIDDPELKQKLSMMRDYDSISRQVWLLSRGQANRDIAFETQKFNIGLARYALGKEELARYPNPLKASGINNLPEGVRPIVLDYLGKRAFALSDPMPRPHPGESREAFQLRYQEHNQKVNSVIAEFTELGYTPQQVQWIVGQEQKARGGKFQMASGKKTIRPTAFAQRLQRSIGMMSLPPGQMLGQQFQLPQSQPLP